MDCRSGDYGSAITLRLRHHHSMILPLKKGATMWWSLDETARNTQASGINGEVSA
jgi:hypothetical protein